MTSANRMPIVAVTCVDGLCVESIERSDGEPLTLAPDSGPAQRDAMARSAGLLVCADAGSGQGGEAFERTLIETALEADMPLLCVGAAMHSLNLAIGGRPAVNVSDHKALAESDAEAKSSYHRIYIAPGSKLAAVLGSGGFVRVNSRHHEGLKEAQKSPRLLASAYSLEDGIIEAVESPDHGLVMGVQFNPERRMELPPQFGRLFQSLVFRAGEGANAAKSP